MGTIWYVALQAAGLGPLLVCRVLMGAAEGFLIPVNTHIIAGWVPVHERGRAITARKLCFRLTP